MHFDDVALRDAVAEMNRYSPMPLVLSVGDASRGLQVRDVFRTGDSAGFATEVGALQGLQSLERPDRRELVPSEMKVLALSYADSSTP